MRVDGVLFFGDVPQGGSKSITFTVRIPTNKTVSVSVSPRHFVVTKTLTLTRSLSLVPGALYNRTYWVFTSSNLTTTYRFMDVVATIPYSRFDANNDYIWMLGCVCGSTYGGLMPTATGGLTPTR
ncbi:MAG: hypothetical protein ACO2PM_17195 [Pyrobaculum sp.]